MKTVYAAGLAFSNDTNYVLLIRKNRPEFLAGKLNAVGGHVDPGETPLQAVRREVLEEAGVDIEEWHPLHVLEKEDSEVHFFFAASDVIFDARTCTEEEIGIYDPDLALTLPLNAQMLDLIPAARALVAGFGPRLTR